MARCWDWIYRCIPDRKWGAGVYALYRNGRLLYIGQTNDLHCRILEQRRRFEFDAVKVCPTPNRLERQRLERRLLYRLRPPLNNLLPNTPGYRRRVDALYSTK